MFKSLSLYRGELSTTYPAPVVYTVPTAKRAEIRSLTVCNGSGGAIQWELYLVANGGSVGDDNRLVALGSPDEVASKGRSEYTTWKILEEGESVRARADTAGMTIHIDGAIVDK